MVSFQDMSSGVPTSWFWNFGDGTTSTQQNPTHTFSTVGDYDVSLTIANYAGNSTATKRIQVIANPPPSSPTAPSTPSQTSITPSPTQSGDSSSGSNQLNPMIFLLPVLIIVTMAVVIRRSKKSHGGSSGQAIPPKPVSSSVQGTVRCKRCGYDNLPGSNVCGKCSLPLKDDEPTVIY